MIGDSQRARLSESIHRLSAVSGVWSSAKLGAVPMCLGSQGVGVSAIATTRTWIVLARKVRVSTVSSDVVDGVKLIGIGFSQFPIVTQSILIPQLLLREPEDDVFRSSLAQYAER